MDLPTWIAHLQTLLAQTTDKPFEKILKRLIRLLTEVQTKNFSASDQVILENALQQPLQNITTKQQAKAALKRLRNVLIKDLHFVPSEYYLTLGVAIGVAIGTSLGISFGVPFSNGIVYGQITGSIIGIVAGLILGSLLDKRKKDAGKVLKSL